MTAPRNPDRLIRAFLAEGQDELPDQVYDAVRDRIEQTNQRVVIGPWRTPFVNNFLRIGHRDHRNPVPAGLQRRRPDSHSRADASRDPRPCFRRARAGNLLHR